ncbi:MAG TPA: energy-coupling factor transporter ATPase [Clostridia bacterium]|nr:energy-coupling factor transporter ATPase [Clostridia bacterium]HPQ47620.1 energy-coupling factor transporter ATPase [Clostridia bacterium]
MDNIIIAKNISYTYMKGSPLEKKALDDVSLTMKKGEFAAIIGHTGSGKSTLIQHLNGLLKPDSGELVVAGLETAGRDLKELRKKVGIVFQYPEHQLFEETVYKDIEFGLLKQNIPDEERARRIKETASILELSESILQKSPYEISGGQKRRAAIAGVLVLEPEILVLDEPAAGLDPAGTRELFDIVTQLYREKQITVILVSHSMELVGDYASRIIVMNEGRISHDGTPSEIFGLGDELEKIGLGTPQISKLMARLSSFYPGLRKDVFTVGDAQRAIMEYMRAGK